MTVILEGAWARVRKSFSFQAAIFDSLKNELDDAILDIGTIDFMPSEATRQFDDTLDEDSRTQSLLFGSNPTPPAHPEPPLRCKCEHDIEYAVFGGGSPLSSAPPSPCPSPTPEKNSRKRKQNKKSKAKRAKNRRREREENPEKSRDPAAHTSQTHVGPAEPKEVGYDYKNIPSASTGYVAKLDESGGGVYTLPELLEMDFELVKWDGSFAKPIVDSSGLIIAVLVGSPRDPGWQGVHDEAFQLLREGAAKCKFTQKCMSHRRGRFATLNAGISFGGGPQMPGNLVNSPVRTAVLQKLLESTAFSRLAGFASSALATWMPRLHKSYDECLAAIINHHNLTPNFSNSVWGAAAFNFGPQTVTDKHRDAANLPHGTCSVTALGNFDYTKGGHIVLWELGLIVEFPPGSTILIPSAAISHSNTPIGDDEERCSFTQYSAGGLFRWVDQNFQKKDKYLASLPQKEHDQQPELDKARCTRAVSFFSTLEELRAAPPAAALPRQPSLAP